MTLNNSQVSHNKGSVRSYTFGFVFSIILTLSSYFVYLLYKNSESAITLEIAVASIMSLAVLQLITQLIFFLHLGVDTGSRWRLGIFVSTISIILLVVIGSIWIMYHLNYNMMPENVDQYMMEKEAIQ